jgi:hypothetical protein
LLGPLVALGQILATMLTPILRILFIPLKYLGIIVAFLGEIIARVSLQSRRRSATSSSGSVEALNKIPFLHLGSGIEAAGNALKGYAADQYAAADQLKRQRKELEGLQFDDAANGLNGLAKRGRQRVESIVNASKTFKLELSKFNARDYDKTPLNLSGSVAAAAAASSMSPQTLRRDRCSRSAGDTPIANSSTSAGQDDRTDHVGHGSDIGRSPVRRCRSHQGRRHHQVTHATPRYCRSDDSSRTRRRASERADRRGR